MSRPSVLSTQDPVIELKLCGTALSVVFSKSESFSVKIVSVAINWGKAAISIFFLYWLLYEVLIIDENVMEHDIVH